MEEIILVDSNDKPIGFMEKIKAHEGRGKLHRAFSIFIFNSKGKMLLQLRSVKKHHFGGLWTNACCSHPRKGEKLEEAVHRKLKQELGFDTELKETFSFVYQAHDKNSGLSEHEYDHVFVGVYDGKTNPNPREVDELRWASVEELKEDVAENPGSYTLWFRLALPGILRNAPVEV